MLSSEIPPPPDSEPPNWPRIVYVLVGDEAALLLAWIGDLQHTHNGAAVAHIALMAYALETLQYTLSRDRLRTLMAPLHQAGLLTVEAHTVRLTSAGESLLTALDRNFTPVPQFYEDVRAPQPYGRNQPAPVQ